MIYSQYCKGINLKFVFVTALCILFSVTITAQSISVNLTSVTVKQAIAEVQKRSGYSFVYSTSDIDTSKDISVSAKTLDQAVKQIIDGQGLSYVIQGKNIIISKEVKKSVDKSQDKKVSGRVTDADGNPLIGVAVIIAGTTQGTETDIDGKFSLAAKSGDKLRFSSIGFSEVILPVDDNDTFNVVLNEDTEFLDEVVVVGYGVQKKSEISGAISSVKSEDMQDRTITSVEDALQGKTAGVQLVSASSSPGATPTIRVRGYSSNTTSDPLYVVDGVRLKSVSGIDPNDIESMEVLKDAASAAIYGAEAGNGVVLITTKKGKTGKTTVSYDFQYTLQHVGKIPNVLNAKEYVDYMVESGTILQSQIDTYWDGKTDTDWAKEIFGTGTINKHNISLSKGTEGGNYYISLTYLDNDGIVKGDKDTFKRISASINAEQKLNSWLTVGSTNQMDRSQRRSVLVNSFGSSIVSSALSYDPLTPVSYTRENLTASMRSAEESGIALLGDGKGNYWASSEFQSSGNLNPFVIRDNDRNKTTTYRISGSVYANFTPWKNFVFTSRFGYQFRSSSNTDVSLPYYGTVRDSNQYLGYSETSTTMFYYQWENFLNYTKSFGKHILTAMAGTSMLERRTRTLDAGLDPNGNDVFVHNAKNFYYLDYKDASAIQSVGGDEVHTAQLSYYGRLGYNFADKYILQASLRADAADLSYLPKNTRWGYFPAVSGAWTISKEKFFAPLKVVINDMKLRASWGQNGSLSALGNYAYSTSIVSSGFYPFTSGLTLTPASSPSSLGNNNIKWETSEQLDFGLDVRMLSDRLSFSMDWYDKKTKDLLVWHTTPSLDVGGTVSPINAGDVSNKGFEFEIGWKDSAGDFSYSARANLSTLKNKVTYLDPSLKRIIGLSLNQNSYPVTYFEEGYPVYYFRGYKFDKIDSTTGEPTFKDLNGDGIVSEADKTKIGDGIPKFNYGITLTAAWKGFDMVVFAQGSAGNDIFCGLTKLNFPASNKVSAIWNDNRWTPTNTSGTTPRANCDEIERYCTSDAMVFDGSYLKIKQIQLGYKLPESILGKARISSMRVYASLEDFFTFTNYFGFDPEVCANSTTGIGVDIGGYPSSKKVIFGINISF